MVDEKEPGIEGTEGADDGVNSPLSDDPLLDLLDALVEGRGKVAAAEALGVNYRTMVTCHESRHVSRRMRKALEQYRDAGADDGDQQVDDVVDVAEKMAALEERVMALEEAYGVLAETVEAQGKQLAELEGKVEGLEKARQRDARDDSEADDGQSVPVETIDAHAEQPTGLEGGVEGPGEGVGQPGGADAVGDCNDSIQRWRPPRRDHGLPDAGVVTLEEQPDEKHAFGPAATLVAEWRGLRTGAAASGGRVDRAWAAVRRWELEVAMLGDFGLTLPPQTECLDESRREDHLRWRREALAAALAKARRLRWLRRVITLGLRWG